MKHLVVTGAASGIGRATAIQAAAEGWGVIVTGRDQVGVDSTLEAIRATGGVAEGHLLDVTDPEAVSQLFADLTRRDLVIGGLVTAAGVDLGGLAHELELGRWQRVLDVNVTGTFLLVQEALQAMMAGGGGSIVLCSSPAAVVGFVAGGATAYGASKGAINSMARTLAVDYAKYGIRVNAVMPGPTETPLMWASVPPEERERMREQLAREIPLGRLADPIEIANTVVWLLSDKSSFTTGSLIGCDGGVLAKASISV